MLSLSKSFNLLRFSLYFLFVSIGEANAQSVISGLVTDKNEVPIQFANASLKNLSGAIKKVSATNDKGRFQIFTTDPGKYFLDITMIGYKKASQPIEIRLFDSLFVRVLLEEDTLLLSEITINQDEPIKTKGDTLIYDISYFSKGNESVVEDILKTLPGITVSENGKVQFQGKEVKKVKIEGDDLFSNNYQLLTKNLSAEVVKEIEVLQSYSDNPILKNIENTDDVSVNIKLKVDQKVKLFGDVKSGLSPDGRYEARANLISISKRFKIYQMSSLNNVGENPVGDIEELLNIDNDSKTKEGNFLAGEFIKSNRPSILDFKRERFYFNNAKFGSISAIIKPSKKITLNILGYLYDDRNPFEMATNSKYFTPSDTIGFNEHSITTNSDRSRYIRMGLRYMPNNSSSLDYKISSGEASLVEFQEVNLNQLFLLKSLNTSSSQLNHYLNFTKKLSLHSAITFNLSYNADRKPQSLISNRNLIFEYFPTAGLTDSIRQLNQNSLTRFESDLNFYRSKNGQKYGIKARLRSVSEYVNTSQVSRSIDVYNNRYTLNQQMLTLESYYSLHIGRLKVTPTLSISHTEVDVKDRIVPSYVFINPNILLKWSINSSSLLSALYSFSNTLSSSTQINTQPVLTSYNNLFFGDPAFKKFDNSFFLLSYQYNKLSKGTTLFTTFFHQNTPNPYLLDMEVKSNYIVSNFNGVASRSLTSGSINYDKYFKSISSNLKVISGISYSSFFSSFNSIITESKSSNSNFDISLRTALNGFFDFHIGSVINLGTTSNSFLTANSIIAQQYFDTYIRSRNTRLNIYIHFERYHLVSISNQPKFYFIDMNVKYKFLDSRFTFFSKLRNLFDESIFERFDVSNQNTLLTTNQLIPRYVLVGFSMRL